jgi:hypothetical protein
MRQTSSLRVGLAILAAAIGTPLTFSLLSLVALFLMEPPIETDGLLSAIGTIWFLTALVGAPLTLALIVFPIAPLWFIHHQARAGWRSFLAGGGVLGWLLGASLYAISAEAVDLATVVVTGQFALTGLAAAAILWSVAYGRRAAVKPHGPSTAPAQIAA